MSDKKSFGSKVYDGLEWLGNSLFDWYKEGLLNLFKPADTRPFWMQFLQWVTGGFFKPNEKEMYKKVPDENFTLTRLASNTFDVVGAAVSGFCNAVKPDDKYNPHEHKKFSNILPSSNSPSESPKPVDCKQLKGSKGHSITM